MIRSRRYLDLAFILLISLLIRLFLARFGTYWRDLNTFIAWSQRLYQDGPAHFYQNWSDYLPGYLYLLWFLGWVQEQFGSFFSTEVLYKLPAIVADLFTGGIIYWLVRRWRNQATARLFSLSYLLNPAVLANSTLWGQVDSVNTLFYLLAILAAAQDRFWQTIVWTAVALVIKPQGLVILPLLAIPYLTRRQWLKAGATPLFSCLIALISFIPFWSSENSLLVFSWQRFQLVLNQYQYTSLNSFNLWALLGLDWQSDAQLIGFLSLHYWGLFLFGLSYLGAVIVLRRQLRAKMPIDQALILTLSLVFLALFLFPTRVHERHLFSALPFLALTASFFPVFGMIYGYFSISYVINLRFAYVWLTEDFKAFLAPTLVKTFALINLSTWFGSWWRALGTVKTSPDRPPALRKVFTLMPLPTLKSSRWLILVIFVFAFMTRFFRLGTPNRFYFDEVYHAFTATEMVKGNPKAWEWWNTPPEGVAYEWTHPPLAKELMAAGILVFGEKPISWRLPGILLGSLNTLLIFGLGELFFPGTTLGLLAAFFYAVDFLPFVQSRIGMNDIYFVFFQLLSFYAWAKLSKKRIGGGPATGKTFYSWVFIGALAWGLALASKWSALYGLLPILWLIGSWFWEEKKTRRVVSRVILTGVVLMIVPVGVYLVAYLPFFTSGHSFSQFIELQKQMWWYHTGLKATHPYTSSWWSWPLDLRPVWYFVDYQSQKIANIYALGNPVIWWIGLGSMFWFSRQVFKKWRQQGWAAIRRSPGKEASFLLIGYLAFFLPWSISPRIMFIYHYLPSLPFLYLITAWVLSWLWKHDQGYQRPIKVMLVVSLLIFLIFYPHLTAVSLPQSLTKVYYWLPGWR